jgi:hypothetical protein
MTQPDASASPFDSQLPGGMRSIYERMTKPQPQDLAVNDRLRQLTRGQIDKILNHFGQVMEHLAAQRDDVVVTRSQDAIGWTIRVELRTNVPDPLA